MESLRSASGSEAKEWMSLRRKGLRYAAAWLLIIGMVAGLSGQAMAWGGTYLYSPTGTISSPGVYSGSMHWVQDAATSHFVVTVLDTSTNTVIYSTPFIAQSAPVGATLGSYSIPAEDLWTIPTGITYELSVSTWSGHPLIGMTLIGLDKTSVVF